MNTLMALVVVLSASVTADTNFDVKNIHNLPIRVWEHEKWNTEDEIKQVFREFSYLGGRELWNEDGTFKVKVTIQMDGKTIDVKDSFYLEELMEDHMTDDGDFYITVYKKFENQKYTVMSKAEIHDAKVAFLAGNWFSDYKYAANKFVAEHPEWLSEYEKNADLTDVMKCEKYFWGPLPYQIYLSEDEFPKQKPKFNFHLDIVGSVFAALLAFSGYMWASKKYDI